MGVMSDKIEDEGKEYSELLTWQRNEVTDLAEGLMFCSKSKNQLVKFIRLSTFSEILAGKFHESDAD